MQKQLSKNLQTNIRWLDKKQDKNKTGKAISNYEKL